MDAVDKVDRVDRRTALAEEVAVLESRLARIEADPKAYARERVAEIDAALRRRKGGPGAIRPREAAPGHISMYTHLQGVREGYEDGKLVEVELAGLRQAVQHRQAELTLMQPEKETL